MKFSYLSLSVLIIFAGCCSTKEVNNVNNLQLKQTRWEIESINSVKIDSSRIYLLFGEDGKFTGNAGCNSMSGIYETENGKIVFKNIITTKMACSDLDKENKFLKAMQKSESYKISGSTLTISGIDDTKIVLKGK